MKYVCPQNSDAPLNSFEPNKATKMNEDFEKKLNQLASHDDQLIKWSKQVTEAIENLCHMDIESSEFSEVKEALVSFVKSWRTFWSVFAPGKELTQNQKVQFTLEGLSPVFVTNMLSIKSLTMN